MAAYETALVMCARKDHPDDKTRIAPGVPVTEKPCAGGCGWTVLVSPSSARLPKAEFVCNPCARRILAERGRPHVLGIAPGAYQQPGDATRVHELEQVGFREIPEEELPRG